MKIYTKTGDKGDTGLYSGKRLRKDDIKIESYGTVDELNSQIGLLESLCTELFDTNTLNQIQNVLFVIGSHLATEAGSDLKLPELKDSETARLEQEIDKMEALLPKLKTFILPGGSVKTATAHICRTVCRRAERRCVTLSFEEDLKPFVVKYLNRLSDYLFVMSRYIAFKEGIEEKAWIP